jgi:hypothetical protein
MKTEAKSGITDTYVSQQRTAERNSSFKMSIVYKKCGGALVGRNGAEKVQAKFRKMSIIPHTYVAIEEMVERETGGRYFL